MSLWRIARRSIEQRGIASLLTALSMAFGTVFAARDWQLERPVAPTPTALL
jgi:hypothetical protein